MRRWQGWRWGVAVALSVGVLLALASGVAGAAEAPVDTRPERGIAVYTEYSGVVVPVGETFRLDLTVANKGRRDETIALSLVSAPKDWKTELKGGGFTVTGVAVPDGKDRRLTFTAEPPKGQEPGTHAFVVEGVTADGALRSKHTITVTTRKRPAGGSDDVAVTTAYPMLRGPSDATFEFSLDVENKSDADRTVNVAAQAPTGWEVNIKPGYEAKLISSLNIKGSQSKTINLEVKPPKEAHAGEYPIAVRVSSGPSAVTKSLTVVLTGIYKLEARTPRGLLSTQAVTGQPTTVSLLVRNAGSAVNRNIELTAIKPENWEVKFEPEKIEALEPGAFRQIQGLSRDQGITVFFSSHLLDQVQRISDRVGIMLRGRLVGVGSMAELASRTFGIDEQQRSLEEVYMRYFREGVPAAV
jgi:uncharacterized membrane protein